MRGRQTLRGLARVILPLPEQRHDRSYGDVSDGQSPICQLSGAPQSGQR